MRLSHVFSHKLVQVLLALAIAPGVAAAERANTIRGAVTTLGPGDMPLSVPGVQVVLRCEQLAQKAKTTVTDEIGHYSFVGLAPDKCSVTATAQGFRSETKTVVIPADAAVQVSFQLDLTPVAERKSEARRKHASGSASPTSARPATKMIGEQRNASRIS